MAETHGSRETPTPAPMMAELDRTLHAIGFEYSHISPEKLVGRLNVTKTCCQPFDMLNGGLSALMAESMSSLGAYMACGFKQVSGVQISTNHLRPARLGDVVEAEAKPIQVGRTVQVWEVQIYRVPTSASAKRLLTSTSRVTVMSNGQASEIVKAYEGVIKKYAKL